MLLSWEESNEDSDWMTLYSTWKKAKEEERCDLRVRHLIEGEEQKNKGTQVCSGLEIGSEI